MSTLGPDPRTNPVGLLLVDLLNDLRTHYQVRGDFDQRLRMALRRVYDDLRYGRMTDAGSGALSDLAAMVTELESVEPLGASRSEEYLQRITELVRSVEAAA